MLEYKSIEMDIDDPERDKKINSYAEKGWELAVSIGKEIGGKTKKAIYIFKRTVQPVKNNLGR